MKKYTLIIAIAGLLCINHVEAMRTTVLRGREQSEIMQALETYKNQLELLNKYANAYPNDLFVLSKMNEKRNIDTQFKFERNIQPQQYMQSQQYMWQPTTTTTNIDEYMKNMPESTTTTSFSPELQTWINGLKHLVITQGLNKENIARSLSIIAQSRINIWGSKTIDNTTKNRIAKKFSHLVVEEFNKQ